MKFKSQAIALALAFATVVTFAMLTACAAWEYPSPEIETLVESTQPAYKTTSVALASTGRSYLGRVVEITGTVEHIANKGGTPAIILSGKVVCAFGEKQKPMVSVLRVGTIITLRGIYESLPARSDGGPYLTPCIRVQ
jgi:hypothetical protein